MTKNARPDLVLIAFAAFLMIAARPLSDVVFQSDTDGGGFGLSNFSKVHASTGAFPRAEIADAQLATAQAGALHATNLTAQAAALATLHATNLTADAAALASAQAGALHATNLTAAAAALASAQAGALHATNLTAGFFSAPAISVGTATNATNVFQRATGGHLEADTVTDRSATNWWATFSIPMFDPWHDFTIKAYTNSPMDILANTIFRYTTADPAPNATPSWELFSTQWLPRVTYNAADVRYPNSARMFAHPANAAYSIHDVHLNRPGAAYWQLPNTIMLYVRDTGQWFHPTNRLNWVFLRQNNTNSELATGQATGLPDQAPNWLPIVPVWSTFDPRPAHIWEIGQPSYEQQIFFTNQHQTP